MNKSKKVSVKVIIILQLGVLLYSLVSVLSKQAALAMNEYGVVSLNSFFWLCSMIILLGIYAIIWQSVLKKMDLSIAYSNKGITLFWSLIWSVLFFKEGITIKNIIGVMMIIIGIMVVNSHD